MGLYSQAARLAGHRANRAASQLVPCCSDQVYNSGQRALQLLRAAKELSSRALWLIQEVSHICAKYTTKLCIAGFESCTRLQLTAVSAI